VRNGANWSRTSLKAYYDFANAHSAKITAVIEPNPHGRFLWVRLYKFIKENGATIYNSEKTRLLINPLNPLNEGGFNLLREISLETQLNTQGIHQIVLAS